jgi:hypothetical protein
MRSLFFCDSFKTEPRCGTIIDIMHVVSVKEQLQTERHVDSVMEPFIQVAFILLKVETCAG